jgi:hypothetical protein
MSFVHKGALAYREIGDLSGGPVLVRYLLYNYKKKMVVK